MRKNLRITAFIICFIMVIGSVFCYTSTAKASDKITTKIKVSVVGGKLALKVGSKAYTKKNYSVDRDTVQLRFSTVTKGLKNIKYKSSNSKVLTVSAKGVVKLKASSYGKTAKIKVSGTYKNKKVSTWIKIRVKEKAEPEPSNSSNSSDSSDMASKALVVYFSRSGDNYSVGNVEKGNTAIVAEKIAYKTGAEAFEIVPVTPYPADYDECVEYAQAEQESNARPDYVGDVENWGDYDVVFIGYPIWHGDLPMIVYNFIEQHDWNGKTVMPFNTHEGSGQGSTQRTIESLCQGAAVKQGIAIRGSAAQNAKESDIEALDVWLEGLGLNNTEKSERKLQIKIGEETLTATLTNNTSAMALVSLLEKGAITIDLEDYGSFEKVGALPETLPQNNEQIDTDAGDLILYQGNQFSIYYDKNSWSLTRLGHIDNVTKSQLKQILGKGDVQATLSIL